MNRRTFLRLGSTGIAAAIVNPISLIPEPAKIVFYDEFAHYRIIPRVLPKILLIDKDIQQAGFLAFKGRGVE